MNMMLMLLELLQLLPLCSLAGTFAVSASRNLKDGHAITYRGLNGVPRDCDWLLTAIGDAEHTSRFDGVLHGNGDVVVRRMGVIQCRPCPYRDVIVSVSLLQVGLENVFYIPRDSIVEL